MRRILISAAVVSALVLSGSAFAARAIVDGRLQVTPLKDNKYQVENIKVSKVEFYGMAGDYVESKHVTGIVLLDGDRATDEQKHIIFVTAQTLKVAPFIEMGRDVKPLEDIAKPPQPAAPAEAAKPGEVSMPAEPAKPADPADPAKPADGKQ